jgi:hypothetical protein
MKLIAGAILILASAVSFAGSSLGHSDGLGIFGFILLLVGILVCRSGWTDLSRSPPETRVPDDGRGGGE